MIQHDHNEMGTLLCPSRGRDSAVDLSPSDACVCVCVGGASAYAFEWHSITCITNAHVHFLTESHVYGACLPHPLFDKSGRRVTGNDHKCNSRAYHNTHSAACQYACAAVRQRTHEVHRHFKSMAGCAMLVSWQRIALSHWPPL